MNEQTIIDRPGGDERAARTRLAAAAKQLHGDKSNVPGKLQDLNMMLLLPGRERTRADWEALYGDAGLAITAMIPVPDTFGAFVIEGRRIAYT